MPRRTLPEQISQLKDEIRRETDAEIKKELLIALRHYLLEAVEDHDGSDGQQATLDIFISHSSTDVKIAKALVELLRDALNIPKTRIRCTSVPEYKLPVGVSVNDQLRDETLTARVFIGLITEASLASTFVVFEIAARWGTGDRLMPVLAAGADASILQEPLKSLNSLRCDITADVHQLLANVASILNLTPDADQEKVNALVNESEGKRQRKAKGESKAKEKRKAKKKRTP